MLGFFVSSIVHNCVSKQSNYYEWIDPFPIINGWLCGESGSFLRLLDKIAHLHIRWSIIITHHEIDYFILASSQLTLEFIKHVKLYNVILCSTNSCSLINILLFNISVLAIVICMQLVTHCAASPTQYSPLSSDITYSKYLCLKALVFLQ